MRPTPDASRCRVRTDDGDRCDRRARDDGFCDQHGPDDSTVDGAERREAADDRTADSGPIAEVREAVVDSATSLVGHPLDNVVAITGQDDGWKATVEVVERTALADAQDVLGRYELLLDDSPVVIEYRRIGRSRRGETEADHA